MARPRKNVVKDQNSLLTPDNVVEIPVEEQPYPLPEGWKWTYWGSCGDFIAGNAFKPVFQGKKGLLYPFYKVGSLKYSDSKGYLYDAENSISEEIQNIIKSSIIPEYSIIFAKIGEAIRLNRRSINEKKCCIDNNLMAFVPKKTIYKYTYYWSLHIDLYKYANATTVPAIRKTDLEKIIFPFPPIDEQQRIVDRIESLFAKLDEAREKAEAVLDGFESRKAAILHKAFTGELTAKWREERGTKRENWKNLTLGDIAKWGSGGTPSRKYPEYYMGNIAWIKTGELNNGYIYEAEEYITTKAVKNSSAKIFPKGTVIVAMYGATIGQCAILGIVAATNQACACAVVNSTTSNRFLFNYLLSQKSNFIKLGKGGAQPNISQTILKNYPILLPSIPEQNEIVCILDTLLEKERQVKEAAENVLERIDLMKKAILAKAFRGELTR